MADIGDEKRRISFTATYRGDGTMFVTSRQLQMFSAVAKQGEWSTVFALAGEYCARNYEKPREHGSPPFAPLTMRDIAG